MRHSPPFAVSALAMGLLLAACQQSADNGVESSIDQEVESAASVAPLEVSTEAQLSAVLAAQPEEVRARYRWRHPQETLTFFGIEPGMTVVEALPGGGWYSKLLTAYLGEEGMLVGADYSLDMYPKFAFMTPEALEKKQSWTADWVAQASAWQDEGPSLAAFHFGAMAEDMAATADAVLFIRALHNLARFENDGAFLSAAIEDAHTVLKPGGVVGVVQHWAPDAAADGWADGSRGYLKRDMVVASFESAGFTLEDSSDININPADQPGEDDIVWRLPPTLSGSGDDPERAEAMNAIGESNRMTLRFRKAE